MKKIDNLLLRRNNRVILWGSGVVTAAICGVMNLVLIPMIEKNTGGIRCFDMQSFGYSYETALQFLAALGESGRKIYLHMQLPLDFIYPVAYTVFFVFLFAALRKRVSKVLLLPLFMAVFDYAENICSICMLRSMAPSKNLAAFASCMTVAKSACLALTAIFSVIYLARLLISRRKARRS
ncbi:MAG: hypothetical protein IJ766_08500 [Clostridia bacterium]|nr:hypothetical protein [Clostridia bacterium]